MGPKAGADRGTPGVIGAVNGKMAITSKPYITQVRARYLWKGNDVTDLMAQ